jgi:hypothetical protein
MAETPLSSSNSRVLQIICDGCYVDRDDDPFEQQHGL